MREREEGEREADEKIGSRKERKSRENKEERMRGENRNR